MDGFFRILEKASSELICTRLYKELKDYSHHIDFSKYLIVSSSNAHY
jgi:hypothetical protein